MTALRHALRRLIRERGFTTTVLFTLAVCIGANLTIFAVVDAILVRSLPFPKPDQLVVAYNSYPGAGADRSAASIANYFDRREDIEAFDSVSLFQGATYTIGEVGAPDRIQGGRITPEFFATLGVPFAMGQTFTDAELEYGPDQVVIISDEFWRTYFDANPEVLGQTIQMDGLPNTVIGVLPPDFRFLSSPARIYRPLSHDPQAREPNARHNNNSQMIARLAPGVALAEARAQMDAYNVVQIEEVAYAEMLKTHNYHTVIEFLHDDHVASVKPMLLLLQFGVLFLLLMGGVNLANLLLIRAIGRIKELAVRRALGAGRSHVAHEVLVETVTLALGGGLVGLLVGALGINFIRTLGTDDLPLGTTISFDARLAAVATIGSIIVGAFLAIPIIWFNLRSKLAPTLQAEGRSGTVTAGVHRLRHGFIAAQVALAFVLLSGAGMLGLSLKRVMAQSPGFEANHVLTGSLALPWKNYPENENRLTFVKRLIPTLQTLPGISNAAISTGLPFSGQVSNSILAIEGYETDSGVDLLAHYLNSVTADYWKAMNIPLLQGRLLEESDNNPESRVAVVDQAFALHYWPEGDAIGHRISFQGEINDETGYTIVGIVQDVKQTELTEDPGHGSAYFPYSAFHANGFQVVVQTPLAPEAVASMIREAILRLDPELPIDNMGTMQTRIDDSLIARRSPAVLAGVFAGVALLLSAVGTYGVLAYAVSQRRREIGVRMALGALPAQILRQFFGLGAKLLLVGLGLGIIGAWFAGRAMQSVLYDIGTFHVGIGIATVAVLAVVVLLATLIPSQRAARISPLEALREE